MSIYKLKIVFTKDSYSPISWLIRWALPRSRFAFAASSHCYVVNCDKYYDAHLFKGIRAIDEKTALKGSTIVKVIEYTILNPIRVSAWLDEQIGKKYDWKGAFGLALKPSRNWAEDDSWFCYELAAAAIKVGGKDVFNNISHITETALFAIEP